MTIYSPPGSDGAIVNYESRYDHYIGGEYVPPAKGQYFDEPLPGDRPELQRDRPRHRRGRRAGAGRRARRGRRAGAAPRSPSARTSSTRSPTGWRRTSRSSPSPRAWENGKPVRETLAADIPLAIDHFRYFAGALRAQEGIARRDRRRHRRLPLPRAARRGRPDHPVELPDPDGGLEARPRAGRRQRRRAQAGRADPGLDPLPDVAGRRPAAAGRAEHRQRLRRRGRQAARLVQPGRQGRLHRRDHHRPPDHAVRLART